MSNHLGVDRESSRSHDERTCDETSHVDIRLSRHVAVARHDRDSQLPLREAIDFVTATISAVINIDLILYHELLGAPGDRMIPTCGMRIVLQERLVIALPTAAVPRPR